MDVVPGLFSGSGDLTGNTGMNVKSLGTFTAGNPTGRLIHYGIREHGMGSSANGMAVSGLVPCVGTFFVFSDYMRPAVRLASIMQAKVCFVWTHDSVGVGEDGPTHQPVEQLASLRAMPGLRVIRPADANEVAAAWRVHLDGNGPTALLLTRQKVPVLDGTAEKAATGVPRGAYVLVPEAGERPDVVLIGTGSEVSVCVTAATQLATRGVSARVVSMPSWDLFEAQSVAYRVDVLPADVPTLAVEAGVRFGWERYADDVVSIDRFGASAPGDVVIARARDHPRARSRARARAARRDRVRRRPMPSAVARLIEFGQSPWNDNLTRALATGGLDVLMREHGIRGVTSNPTIFEKAMAVGSDYDGQLRELIGSGKSTEDAYWELVLTDIANAADRLRPIYDELDGADGFVSVEVSPNLAHDTTGTVAQALELWQRLARPNVMIKIPATAAGIPAITETLAAGVNVNITLIFSLQRYQEVIEAFALAFERRLLRNDDVSRLASVASFFVSRVDTETDRRLPEGSSLRGKAAVANAKLAYQLFLERFAGTRWDGMATAGARKQRPLWASTSTKNPAYSPTLYVDNLIGKDTVNTLAQPSIDALANGEGNLRPDSILEDVEGARKVMADLAAAGVDFDDVTATLEREGVDSFAKSFNDALATLEKKAAELK